MRIFQDDDVVCYFDKFLEISYILAYFYTIFHSILQKVSTSRDFFVTVDSQKKNLGAAFVQHAMLVLTVVYCSSYSIASRLKLKNLVTVRTYRTAAYLRTYSRIATQHVTCHHQRPADRVSGVKNRFCHEI